MTQKQNESITETATAGDSVAEAPQQIKEGAGGKGKPCSRCSSCLKCKLASGGEAGHSHEPDAHAKPLLNRPQAL